MNSTYATVCSHRSAQRTTLPQTPLYQPSASKPFRNFCMLSPTSAFFARSVLWQPSHELIYQWHWRCPLAIRATRTSGISVYPWACRTPQPHNGTVVHSYFAKPENLFFLWPLRSDSSDDNLVKCRQKSTQVSKSCLDGREGQKCLWHIKHFLDFH